MSLVTSTTERPGLREFFGGPLNAQERRQAMVEAVLAAVPFRQVVETGPDRGRWVLDEPVREEHEGVRAGERRRGKCGERERDERE